MMNQRIFPFGYATITKDGIMYCGSLFTASIAIREQWFLISDSTKEKSIPVCFDPDNPEILLLLIEGVGLVQAVRVQEWEVTDNNILQSYYSIIEELKMKWKRRRAKKRSRNIFGEKIGIEINFESREGNET